MHAVVAKPLDWFSIRLASLSVKAGASADGQLAAAEALLHRPDFVADFAGVPPDFEFIRKHAFRFASQAPSPWVRNNTVHGRFFPAAPAWTERATVILLHGWNAEVHYRTLFPWLASCLNRVGVNALLFELPYHSQRKPLGRDEIRNFLSDDVLHVVHAAHQSLADARALVAWLQAQGCRQVGVWGISLGGWLAGILASAERRLDFAVLMTPIVRMDRVIAELEFCRSIRRALRGKKARLEPMNLTAYRLQLPPERCLVVASEHDLFAPIATIEELRQHWHLPEIWRVRHGHISVMMSRPVLQRTVDWIAGQPS